MDWTDRVNAPLSAKELERMRVSIERSRPYGRQLGQSEGKRTGPGAHRSSGGPAAKTERTWVLAEKLAASPFHPRHRSSSRPCFASIPPAERTGSNGTKARRRRGPGARTSPGQASPESCCGGPHRDESWRSARRLRKTVTVGLHTSPTGVQTTERRTAVATIHHTTITLHEPVHSLVQRDL